MNAKFSSEILPLAAKRASTPDLGEGMSGSSIKSWMMGSNPRLKGRAPIEVIHDGYAYEVMGAARTFVTRR